MKKGREGGGGKDSQIKVEKGGRALLRGYYYHAIQLITEALPMIPMIHWVSKAHFFPDKQEYVVSRAKNKTTVYVTFVLVITPLLLFPVLSPVQTSWKQKLAFQA